MDITNELQRLQQLHDSGAIGDDELARAQERLFDEASLVSDELMIQLSETVPALVDPQTRQWGMLLHLSQLAGFLVPLAGWIVPVVIWQVKKTELPGLDAHGKVVVNWMISEIIYGIGFFLLSFLIIGIPLLIALGIVGIVFPIIGGIKANDGELWQYPMSITFLK